MPLPDAPLIRDPEPLYRKLYAHITEDPAQHAAFIAIVGILSMIQEEAAVAQEIYREYDAERGAPASQISIGMQLGKIEMANRTIRAVANGLRHLPLPPRVVDDLGDDLGDTEAAVHAKVARRVVMRLRRGQPVPKPE